MKATSLRIVIAAGLIAACGALTAGPALAGTQVKGVHAQITGSGSSWAANAVNQWVADVQKSGLQVVFTPDGSASGRRDFANQTSDFAVSDIGYQGVDPDSGASDTACSNPSNKSTCLDYAYVPIVAGGTSFPYQVRVGGQLVTNLRLSGLTLTKIFTNTLGTKGSPTYMNWDNPEITADNNGRKLPSLPITPVVHSEGSGDSAQFTEYMATEYPSIWTPYNSGKDVQDEYFPQKSPQVAQDGSDGVINFVTSTAGNGSIGYDEYSYALGKNYPVVQLENKAGYFVSPTQYNVAVALTKAQINYTKGPDYLLQKLNNVYTNSDPRAYPMSSYSYGIIPTGPNSNDARMSTAKRQTIADFLNYSTCQGQAEIGPIGYSALPINLVEASFKQIALLHAADGQVDVSSVNVASCHNPTFIAGHPTENYLAKIAPEPLACQKTGAGPCGTAPAPNQNVSPGAKVTQSAQPSNGGSNNNTSPGATPTAGAAGPPGSGGSALPTADSVVPGGGASAPSVATSDGSSTGGTTLIGDPTNLADASNGGIGDVLGVLAGILLVVAIALPSVIANRMRKRKSGA